jgi:dihydrofolate synthase/folylpolyglutamate synthase
MMKYQTLQAVIKALYQYLPGAGVTMRHNYTLGRMKALLNFLGDPQEKLRIIHIAGTSGKTSTTYFIEALLRVAGKTTGMTISPHIVSITERLQVNGQPITDKDFVKYANVFLPLVEQSGLRPTYFELLIAFCYWVFNQLNLDYVVVETGLGGLKDGTNTVTRADKLCVITDIGYDHTEILGETLPEIAYQKAGIIQPGNQVFVQNQDSQVLKVIGDFAKKQNAKLDVVKQGSAPKALPTFQQRNWSMAMAAYNYLAVRDGLPKLTASQLAKASNHQPPARLEIFKVGDKTVIIDGAHNGQKMEALNQALKARGITQVAAVANFVNAAEPKLVLGLKALQQIAQHLIVPEFEILQDMARRSVPAKELAVRAGQAGFKSVEIIPKPEAALKALLARPEPVLLITGSLYLASQMRPLVIKLAKN